MKKLLILIIFASTLLASNASQKIKAQILEKILSEISINKEMKIWSDDKTTLENFRNNKKFKIVKNCMDSNTIILKHKKNLDKRCLDKNIFVLSYSLLNQLPQSFGSFFWKKGRPNIVLIKSRLQKRNINISNKLEPYTEDRVW